MRQYFLHNGTSEEGPFTLEQLKERNIQPDTLIWFEGLQEWVAANTADDLKPLFSIKPPPLKVATPPSMQYQYEESKPRSKSKYIWTALSVLAIVIIAVLIYSNNQSQQALTNLQSSVSQKEHEETMEKLKQAETRNRWSDFIKLETGDYRTSAFGGISDLDLAVSNSTEYVIDEIEVEIDYIKESGGVYKTETVVFKNLPVNVKQTKYAPESSRGTSVDVRVKSITAQAFNFCYNIYRTGVSGDDPWKCQ